MTITLLTILLLSLQAPTQIDLLERQGLDAVQQIEAVKIDASLPRAAFSTWFNKVIGPEAGVVWQLTECGERRDRQNGAESDLEACIEASALLPDGCKVMVAISVGTFKKGILGEPAFHSAVIEQNDQFYRIDRLRDLPDLLRRAESGQSTRPRRSSQPAVIKPVRLPVVATNLLPVNQWREPGNPLSSSSALLFNLETPSELRDRLTVAAPEPPAEAPPASVKTAPPKPQQMREGLLRGRALVKVNPIYPTSTKTLDVFFRTVVVAIVVSEEGRVINAKVVRGHPTLHAAAIEAAQKWVFEPTTLKGQPVKVESMLTFVLDNLNN